MNTCSDPNITKLTLTLLMLWYAQKGLGTMVATREICSSKSMDTTMTLLISFAAGAFWPYLDGYAALKTWWEA
jgi:hypothetical protein